MNLSSSFLLYQQLHNLVDKAKTGNPNELSNKLGISVSCLYAILKTLNDNNIQIAYCKQMNSYIYLTDKKIETGFTNINDPNLIKGGHSLGIHTALDDIKKEEINLHLFNKTPPTCSGNISTLDLEMHFEKTKG
jgi:hypothetical protein